MNETIPLRAESDVIHKRILSRIFIQEDGNLIVTDLWEELGKALNPVENIIDNGFVQKVPDARKQKMSFTKVRPTFVNDTSVFTKVGRTFVKLIR